jgi:serine/threonine protein kinase
VNTEEFHKKSQQESVFQGSTETTIILPEEQFKKNLGVDPASFTATELEEDYYQRLIRKRSGSEKYLFTEVLDVGGMGAIFSVQDQDVHRPLAMKVLLPTRKNVLKTIESFVKEVKINGFLEHPNIIPIHEFGLLKETGIFFTMKLVQGESLGDVLAEMKRGKSEYLQKYNTYVLLSIFRKVCDAVSYAHSMGIIHQDIKPENIIVGHYGEAFLIDWGTAKIVADPEKEQDPVKRRFLTDIAADSDFSTEPENRVHDSPPFMSPEQAKGENHLVDERSDIFLLGATLYTMFTLTLPYAGETLIEVLKKAKARDLIPPEIRSPDRQIPKEICRVIKKAMAKNRADRYQTVEELAQDIDQLIAGRWLSHEIKVFHAGDTLIREGEAGEEAYLIVSGNVLVTKDMSGTNVVLGTYQEGDIIGEMSLISDEPRSATVQALEDTTVAVLTKHMLAQNLKKLPPYMEKILSALTDRLQHTDTMIHPHLASDCTAIVLKYLRLLFKDRFGNNPRHFALPFRAIVEEISQDLGIPGEKIRNVLETAIYLKLITRKDDHIQILDMKKLVHYTRHVKGQTEEED